MVYSSAVELKLGKKLRVLLLFPVTVFFWLIGWSLTWIGSRENSESPKRVRSKPRNDDALVSFELSPQCAEEVTPVDHNRATSSQ